VTPYGIFLISITVNICTTRGRKGHKYCTWFAAVGHHIYGNA